MEVGREVPAAARRLCLDHGPILTHAADLAARLNAIVAPVVAQLGYDLVRVQLLGTAGGLTDRKSVV